jgi:hypothetical protein
MSSVLSEWSTFFAAMVASSASLIGLTFIVITLISGAELKEKAHDGLSTFSTPTVIHFGTALLVAALLLAPWHVLLDPAICIGIVATCGLIYLTSIMLHTRRLRAYSPDVEDWIWYSILPFLVNAILLGGAIALALSPRQALFVLAAAVVLLIFIGIRNAWDVVTFIATGGPNA